jgi:hypothetical protein
MFIGVMFLPKFVVYFRINICNIYNGYVSFWGSCDCYMDAAHCQWITFVVHWICRGKYWKDLQKYEPYFNCCRGIGGTIPRPFVVLQQKE